MEELYTQEILKNKQNHYEHITKRERDIISKHLSAGKRISYIAKALNRSKSSICEELNVAGIKEDKPATSMNNALIDMLKNTTVKTITYDNGTENMNHLIANKILHCQSYFCRPYCSADKGSVENRNKILRQFLPKKTNFDLISQHQIDIIRNKINNRPMKVLNWNTPCSLFFSS